LKNYHNFSDFVSSMILSVNAEIAIPAGHFALINREDITRIGVWILHEIGKTFENGTYQRHLKT